MAIPNCTVNLSSPFTSKEAYDLARRIMQVGHALAKCEESGVASYSHTGGLTVNHSDDPKAKTYTFSVSGDMSVTIQAGASL